MKPLFLAIILFSFVVGGCYDNNSNPPSEEFEEGFTCNMAELRKMCENGCYNITSDIICVGRVTSSDSEGNFYRSIVIEDNSGGLEVKLGIYNIATQYPIGLMVSLHLNGTAIMNENGVVQVGLPPQSFDSSPREMEAQAIIDKHIIRSNSVEPTTPILCDIKSLNNSMCGRFIRIENIHHTPLPDREECTILGGYHRFTDAENNAIFTYISTYADFANMEVPLSDVAIQGILYYETVGMGVGGQFVIKPRFEDDISIYDTTI
jgi:hypothetical protein